MRRCSYAHWAAVCFLIILPQFPYNLMGIQGDWKNYPTYTAAIIPSLMCLPSEWQIGGRRAGQEQESHCHAHPPAILIVLRQEVGQACSVDFFVGCHAMPIPFPGAGMVLSCLPACLLTACLIPAITCGLEMRNREKIPLPPGRNNPIPCLLITMYASTHRYIMCFNFHWRHLYPTGKGLLPCLPAANLYFLLPYSACLLFLLGSLLPDIPFPCLKTPQEGGLGTPCRWVWWLLFFMW